MILYQGKLYESSKQDILLTNLEFHINQTRKTQKLDTITVINALAALGQKIEKGAFNEDIASLDVENIQHYVKTLANMLKKEVLQYKVLTELGENSLKQMQTCPPDHYKKLMTKAMPLGTILHIAAGNVDGLPAFSAAEGLLTGNINILKLPQGDNGLSLKIITSLIEIEPHISDFIYVFDTPSTELAAIKQMAQVSDGIVTWGGDAAIAAVRNMAPLGTRLIEWGHKLSFAYISGYENKEQELAELAEHILMTKQLLCSSCQTIFLDTEDMNDIYNFCDEFLPYMERAASQYPGSTLGVAAEISLKKYNDTLEKIIATGKAGSEKSYQGERCSLTACENHTLELSYMFGNCLVKPLAKDKIFDHLRNKKGYLQTGGLICREDKRQDFTELLLNSGVVRVTRGGNMSETFCGEAHDGEFPLRRYVRIVNWEL